MDRLMVMVLPDAPFEPPKLAPAKEGDVGLDLCVCIAEDEIVVPAGGFIDVPTGIAIKLPWYTWASIRPRSSTFAKRQLFVMNGTIDNGYTGPIKVFLFNPNRFDVPVKKGDRLAQLVLHQMQRFDVEYVEHLPDTKRGSDGFGSTGGFNP